LYFFHGSSILTNNNLLGNKASEKRKKIGQFMIVRKSKWRVCFHGIKRGHKAGHSRPIAADVASCTLRGAIPYTSPLGGLALAVPRRRD
jgi:hypothetical protein